MSNNTSEQLQPVEMPVACEHEDIVLHVTGARGFGADGVTDNYEDWLVCRDCGEEMAARTAGKSSKHIWLPE